MLGAVLLVVVYQQLQFRGGNVAGFQGGLEIAENVIQRTLREGIDPFVAAQPESLMQSHFSLVEGNVQFLGAGNRGRNAGMEAIVPAEGCQGMEDTGKRGVLKGQVENDALVMAVIENIAAGKSPE